MTSRPRTVPATPHRLTGRLEVSTATGSDLGDTRVKLLEAIALTGSISQAAKRARVSPSRRRA